MELAAAMEAFNRDGYAVIPQVFNHAEIDQMTRLIENSNQEKDNFRKSSDLFAIRQFVKEIPEIQYSIFSEVFNNILWKLAGPRYKLVKSIYFDKPGSSNWYVSYHQDLNISVAQKHDEPGFNAWTLKHNQYAVQPPLDILENIVTIRIHLDDTDENNGALRVIPGSHRKGIYRPEKIDWQHEKEAVCTVAAGGIMFMKPLVLHSSSRTTNNKKRRVVHLEFSDKSLPGELKWAELL